MYKLLLLKNFFFILDKDVKRKLKVYFVNQKKIYFEFICINKIICINKMKKNFIIYYIMKEVLT